MKRVVFIACFAYFSSLFSPKASVHQHGVPISLSGTMPPPDTVRTPSSLMEACQNAAGVDMLFNYDLADLTIKIIDQTGETAYQKKLHAVAGDKLAIDTNGWTNGEYFLIIMDEEKEYLEGKFEITE